MKRLVALLRDNNIEACHRLSKKKEWKGISKIFFVIETAKIFLTSRNSWESWTWNKLVFRRTILYLWIKVCVHIAVQYGRRLNISIPWIESVAYVSGGAVKTKISENSLPLPATHANDFKEHFPDANLAPPSESLSRIWL